MNLMKSKKFVAVLFVMALCLSVFGAQAFAANKDLKGKVSFSYPDGWTATDSEAQGMIAVALMNASEPMIGLSVTFSENIPAGTVLPDEATWKQQIEAGMAASGSKVEVIECKKTTLGGKDAMLIEYKTEGNGMTMQFRQTMTINGSDMLVVTGSFMDMSKLDAGKKILAEIEKSVAFK